MKQFLSGLSGRKGVYPVASAGTALALVMIANQAAQAAGQCSPAAANNVVALCTSGVTTNQGAGAPGTSTGTSGYGSGVETNVNVTVSSGNIVTGTLAGINIGFGTVFNDSSASITSAQSGILSAGNVIVTNSGTITGTSNRGIAATAGSVTLVNNSGQPSPAAQAARSLPPRIWTSSTTAPLLTPQASLFRPAGATPRSSTTAPSPALRVHWRSA